MKPAEAQPQMYYIWWLDRLGRSNANLLHKHNWEVKKKEEWYYKTCCINQDHRMFDSLLRKWHSSKKNTEKNSILCLYIQLRQGHHLLKTIQM